MFNNFAVALALSIVNALLAAFAPGVWQLSATLAVLYLVLAAAFATVGSNSLNAGKVQE